jgi:hypothetical protein
VTFLSTPTWDISDEEIAEWQQTAGMQLTALAAERIRDGYYAGGQEIYPQDSPVYKEISKSHVDEVMAPLAERGMARKSGSAWLAIAPGRMEPSVRRAVGVLLDRRSDLPPALAAELDAWKLHLDTLASSDRDTTERAGRAAKPLRAGAVG